ncbi:MAG: Smr/MutS family protein [Flavobacteriaceae bacterium]|nr:Smr/MutS family protein [Flavobacteriaceae bacterium]
MIKFKIGDKVKVIDDNTHGIITKISENSITMISDFGFEETYQNSEILPDIGLEEEIPQIKNNVSKKQSKQDKEKIQNDELKELIEENFVKNSENFREKLEEKYKKEIKISKKRKGTFVLDLHYGQLENYSAQLPVQHILKRQLNAAINGIEKAKNEGYAKIILVHGKGKGVLEEEIKKYLDAQHFTFYDADFRQYKLGATEVELK